MNRPQALTHIPNSAATNFNRLPGTLREPAAEQKYSAAVSMYSSTSLTLREVAEACGVTAAGLSAHIGKHHRRLLFDRYGLDPEKHDPGSLKVKPPKGQSLKTHLKYKDAIEACGDIAYIEYNVSEIARMFHLNGTDLASQLYAHYPDVIPDRERARGRLGISDRTQRGVRASTAETYAEALAMYRDTDLTVSEAAKRCGVSASGLSRYLRFYRKDIVALKSGRRKAARKDAGSRRAGELSGNGSLYGPRPETEELYSKAMELYRSTSMTVDEITASTGVPADGFKGYLHQWHRDDRREPLSAASAKYARAVSSLRESPRDVTKVAAEFGLNPDVFRIYLKAHEPELASMRGMARLSNGKLVKRSTHEKYREAINEYATTAEDLKSIARRHGIAYSSILGFVARNCPAERESHQKLIDSERGGAAPKADNNKSLK